jgi:PAS domain S-box-containing protein
MPFDVLQSQLPPGRKPADRTPDFVKGGGEMGALMRAHDWRSTELGPSAAWPQPLRTAVRLMLNNGHPMYIFWGEHGACLYNDAYRQSIGPERHPGSLGRPAREVWDEIWDMIGPQIQQVMSGNGATWHVNQLVPITRHGHREDVYWTYSYGPIDDKAAASGVGGVLVVCTETTEAVHAQHRQAFQIRLEDELRNLSDPQRVMAVAAQMLGQHLQVGRCGYGEVDETGTHFTVDSDWTDRIMTSFAGRMRLDDFGPQIIEEFRAGRIVRLNDPLSDSRTAASASAYKAAGGIRAGIAVPLVKEGRFAAALYVHQTSPRRWSDNEVELVSVVAERTWAAVERSRAESALRERERDLRASETQFRTFAQAVPNHVWTAPATGLLDWFNDRVYEYSGATKGELDGLRWTKIVHPDDMAVTGDRWAAALLSGQTYETEFRLRRHDGVYRWHIARAVPIRDAACDITRWIGTNTDIEDQKTAAQALADINSTLESRVAERTGELMAVEEELRQSQKMEAIGQLTGGIAHDFNNMLTGISGSLEMIGRRLDAGRTDGLQRYLDVASSSAQRAAALTHRLLAFARQQSLDIKGQDINALVVSLDDILRRTLGEKIVFATHLASGLWPALTDANQLESALLNLAINARDAMPDGGQLTIETASTQLDKGDPHCADDVEAGQYVVVCVSDTGVGMPEDVIGRAFNPFFTTKPIGQGTGLGLSMIYGFMKQSGGHARIYSAVGKGTTVKLYLRRAHEKAGQPSTAHTGMKHGKETERGRGEIVLVVEDDTTVRQLITETLEELGYGYLAASTAQEAIPHLRSGQSIDLLVTDVGLPNMNGRQLAEIARQHRPELKILFITGYAENAAARADFLPQGAQILAKPFALDALSAKIRELLAGHPR